MPELVNSTGSDRRLPRIWNNKLSGALRRPAAQQPDWPDKVQKDAVLGLLSALPALVPPEKIRALREDLARVALGEAFLIQGGDCAETFAGNTEPHVLGNATTLLRLAAVITDATGLPSVRIGRIAGQFAKPRSAGFDDLGLPAYRGDIVNSAACDPGGRVPDPLRMIDAYRQARTSLDLLRSRLPGQVYTSHEALLLDFERSQLVFDQGTVVAGSAHFLWVGERTRQAEGAHLAFAELIANPVGIKIGPGTTPSEVAEYCDRLDPGRQPGRLTLISRMGKARIRDVLAPVVDRVTSAGHQIVWQCDPMHGNTRESATGYKTRHFDDIIAEIDGFFDVHKALGTIPGGLHLEFTGDPVTECLGGGQEIAEHGLSERYETNCDPRLNAPQALELAHHVGGLLRNINVTQSQ
jgi:3-deoxy-D-arabino-heptulosonate 7-phosphate (DAHP) synthase class II